jgi:hypothetical protein
MAPRLNVHQFAYDQPEFGEAYTTHRIRALSEEGGTMGTMLWSRHGIRNIGTTPGMERRGVATQMWEEGHRMAEQHARIPKPKHSADRTAMGDAWARSVGGRLPKQVKYKGTLGEARPA